jgi:hypothetical protein
MPRFDHSRNCIANRNRGEPQLNMQPYEMGIHFELGELEPLTPDKHTSKQGNGSPSAPKSIIAPNAPLSPI